MKIKRLHVLLVLLAVFVCAIPFHARIKRSVSSVVQIVKGRKTVADRVREFGVIVHSRLASAFAEAGVKYPPREIILIGLKQEKLFEIWVSDGASGFKYLKTYPILAASGKIGPKLAEGDQQVPEGIYEIESLNPNSAFHLSLRVNYPNRFDREKARVDRREGLGSDIMIHGSSVSIGCLAIGDQAIEDVFVLAADTGIENIKLLLSPIDFRKSDLSMQLPNMPAWTSELYTNIGSELSNLRDKNGRDQSNVNQ